MPNLSANLSLPLMQPSQAQKHVTHNEALELLDLLAQLRIVSFGALTPPSLPQAGDVYAVGTGATGDWAGKDGKLAAWTGEAWRFVQPQPGWRATARADGGVRVYGANGWAALSPGNMNNLDHVGVNTGADATNRLAVAAPASLFTHDGAGHRVKVNKSTATDTASLLFQSDWSGRAEMGLAGDDNFSVKVSPDGASWTTALELKRYSGDAVLRGVEADSYGGAGVQSGPRDATAGRLVTVGGGGLLSPINYGTGDDLDTIAPGFIGSASVSNTPGNVPESGAFTWAGFGAKGSSARGMQLLGKAAGGGNDLYWRSQDGSWSAWKEIVHSGLKYFSLGDGAKYSGRRVTIADGAAFSLAPYANNGFAFVTSGNGNYPDASEYAFFHFDAGGSPSYRGISGGSSVSMDSETTAAKINIKVYDGTIKITNKRGASRTVSLFTMGAY